MLASSLDYIGNGCIYSINISNKRIIDIQIEDKHYRKTLTLTITQPMLRDYRLSIEDLQHEMYKQHVHQKYREKQLLSHHQGCLVIKFTYPKCKVRPISFKCEWKSDNQQALSIQLSMKETSQKIFDHFSKQIDAKLTQAFVEIQRKFFSINKRMYQRAEQRLSNFDLRCVQMLQYNQQSTNQILKKQKEELIDSNLRYFDEFRLIKTDLQTSLINCDLNIRELSLQVSDIQSFVLEKQKETKDQLKKIASDMRVEEKLREIKQELECIENMKSQADRALDQLRKQRAEIKSKHAKKQIQSNTSETVATNFSFSSGTYLQKSSRMQETFQTTIQEGMTERQASKSEPLPKINSLNQLQIGLMVIEQERQQDSSPSQ